MYAGRYFSTDSRGASMPFTSVCACGRALLACCYLRTQRPDHHAGCHDGEAALGVQCLVSCTRATALRLFVACVDSNFLRLDAT